MARLSIICCCLLNIIIIQVTKCEKEMYCSNNYSTLVEQITGNDKNMFEVQNVFFPPDRAPPVFVTVMYNYFDSNNKSIWVWSSSTFYLYHPLSVFQFTSLFFSDVSKRTAKATLNLNPDCQNASVAYMKLLTQRLKLYATENSINSPISDDYSAKAETVDTLSQGINNNTNANKYTFSVFSANPCLTSIFIVAAVFYYNAYSRNCRMNQFIKKLKSSKATQTKYDLQNELILSILIITYAIVISSTGVYYTASREELNNEYFKHFTLRVKSSNIIHIVSLGIVTFCLDSLVIVLFVVTLVVLLCFYCIEKKSENPIKATDSVNWLWRFCAYSMIFPLFVVANHLNYIIIAFIHDVYHATGVALIYGIIIFFLYGALIQLPEVLPPLCLFTEDVWVFAKDVVKRICKSAICCCKKVNEPAQNTTNHGMVHNNDDQDTSDGRSLLPRNISSTDEAPDQNTAQALTQTNITGLVQAGNNLTVQNQAINNSTEEQNSSKLTKIITENPIISYFLAKLCFVYVLVGYLTYNMLIYYYLPINNAIDDATNHLLTLYQATAIFFAAIAAYFFLNRPTRSPLNIFTRAEYEYCILKEDHKEQWKDFSADEKDKIMAKELLSILKTMKTCFETTRN